MHVSAYNWTNFWALCIQASHINTHTHIHSQFHSKPSNLMLAGVWARWELHGLRSLQPLPVLRNIFVSRSGAQIYCNLNLFSINSQGLVHAPFWGLWNESLSGICWRSVRTTPDLWHIHGKIMASWDFHGFSGGSQGFSPSKTERQVDAGLGRDRSPVVCLS